MLTKFSEIFESGAVQRLPILVDLEKFLMLQNEYLDAKIGFDSEENELSQVCLSKQAMTTPKSKIWLW